MLEDTSRRGINTKGSSAALGGVCVLGHTVALSECVYIKMRSVSMRC